MNVLYSLYESYTSVKKKEKEKKTTQCIKSQY